MFFGSMVALITPMLDNGELDETGLRRLVDFHVQSGTKAIIACGTTGEAVTLTEEEQLKVIKIVKEQAAAKLAVIAGTGSNCTHKTINFTLAAMKLGIDGCLIVTPYYNKPTQEGLFQHYVAIADNAALPIILYNVPARTAVDLLPETIARLAKIPNIVGIKEATGKLDRAQEIYQLCGNSLDIYSGDDITGNELMLNGHAKGVISVTANVVPAQMHQLCEAAIAGEKLKATELDNRLAPLHKALFLESNPIPVKWALHRMGLIEQGIRLPLTVLAEKFRPQLETVMQQLQII